MVFKVIKWDLEETSLFMAFKGFHTENPVISFKVMRTNFVVQVQVHLTQYFFIIKYLTFDTI